MAYTPTIRVANGKIHGAKRKARAARNGATHGYTAFISCIHFSTNLYSDQDLEKFLQFEHDAWNTTDANGITPLEHALNELYFLNRMLEKHKEEVKSGKNASDFTLNWYKDKINLMERVIEKTSQHIDIKDMEDKTMVRTFHIACRNHQTQWGQELRSRLIAQGFGIHIFPRLEINTHSTSLHSIPMLVASQPLLDDRLLSIIPWLEAGAAHDPPDTPEGTGLDHVVRELEGNNCLVLDRDAQQVHTLLQYMVDKLENGLSPDIAARMAASKVPAIARFTYEQTQLSAGALLGVCRGLSRVHRHREADPGKTKEKIGHFVRAVDTLNGPITHTQIANLCCYASRIMDPGQVEGFIDKLQERYGKPEPHQHISRVDTALGMICDDTVYGSALDTQQTIIQAKRLLSEANQKEFDLQVAGRLIQINTQEPNANSIRALMFFLDGRPNLEKLPWIAEDMLYKNCSGNPFKTSTRRPDTHLLAPLLDALSLCQWAPSHNSFCALVDAINEGQHCAWPVVHLHMEHIEKHGKLDGDELRSVLGKLMSEPLDRIVSGSGYEGMYSWSTEDMWPAKVAIADTFFKLARKSGVHEEKLLRTCDNALKEFLSSYPDPSQGAIGMMEKVIIGCAWSHEKSHELMGEGKRHWMDTGMHEIVGASLARISHEALQDTIEASSQVKTVVRRF